MNYPGNSNKTKTGNKEQKKVTKVIQGKTKVRKKSEMKKVMNSIISDEVGSIKNYAIYEVIIPTVVDTISQLIKGSIDMMFYGKTGDYRRGGYGAAPRSNVTRVSYGKYYDDRREPRTTSATRQYSYDDITFETKSDAEIVLQNMDDILEEYGVVRVSDIFDLAGQSGNVDTNFNYGWTNLRSATVERNRYGEWYIRLPRPCCIK